MTISNETTVLTWKCYNGSIAEMENNGTDGFHDGEFRGNLTGCVPEGGAEGMQLSEILTVTITSVLGLIGIVFNIAILAVTFKKKLIKKDYRMVYYMFITTGDLFFAINCLFVGINIAFQSVYVFKLFGVCLTLMLILGVIAYEWSAICIILLLVDLVWTIKHPFKDNKNMKIFSKIGCVWTFFLGIILAVGPFLYWNDSPYELPFCSIGNLYGKNLGVYQYEVVIALSTLVAIMILVSGILLFEIYRSHTVSDCSVDPKRPADNDKNAGKKYTDTSKPTNRGTPGERNSEMCYVISVDVMPQNTATESTSRSGGTGTAELGEVNSAFVGDIGDIVEDLRKAKAKRHVEKYKDTDVGKRAEENTVNDSRREVRRREFNRACRTVGFFMAAYLGCCTPYLIWNALGLACGSECSDNDRPETRAIRAMVATALYLLPIIDPILYTRRFDVFKQASVGMMRKFCICEMKRRNSTVASL